MFMKECLKKYSQDQQDQINNVLISEPFKDLVQTHIEATGQKMLFLQADQPLFVAEYTTLQQQLRLWQGFAQYINEFVQQFKAATGNRR